VANDTGFLGELGRDLLDRHVKDVSPALQIKAGEVELNTFATMAAPLQRLVIRRPTAKSLVGPAHFPMVTERIDDPAQDPSVPLRDGHDLSGPCGNCLLTDPSRVPDDQQHADRTSAE
jgi:hypothetical protein